MPSKKKKYNARFPAGRIKKIMQSDEEIGKVAQAVPVIISRTLELFVESLLTKTLRITNSRNAKTLSTSHMKQCIMSEQRFDFLRELVKNVPDISVAEEAANYNEEDGQSSPEDLYPDSDTPFDLSMPSTSGGSRSKNSMRNMPMNRSNGGQTYHHQQYKQHPQNGANSTQNAGINENELRQRIRQRIGGGGGGVCSTQSVIMHTASVTQSNSVIAPPPSGATALAQRMTTAGNYVQPLKLMRSESSPANTSQHMWHVAPNAGTPQQQQHQGQKRLRHQAQSVPCSSSSNNNGNCHSSPPKRQRPEQLTQQQQAHHSQTAIPAPVFSYDLCNKPVVKIDYSNLPLTPAAATGTSEHFNTTATAAAASISTLPMSAPVTNANFNFSTDAPIINIDLSNIVTNNIDGSNTSIGMGGNKLTASPAVATISIGPLPADLVNSSKAAAAAASLGALKVPTPISIPTTYTTPPSNQSTDSKMVCNVTTAESTSTSSSSAASSSSCSPSTSSSLGAASNSQQSGSKSSLKATTEIMATMTAPMKTMTVAKLSTECKNSNSFLELDEDYDNI